MTKPILLLSVLFTALSCATAPKTKIVSMPSYGQFKKEFLKDYISYEPEEGTTIGADVGNEELRDVSPEGLSRRYHFFKRTLDTIDQFPRHHIELKFIRALALFEIRSYELGDQFSNVEWSLYPYTIISHMKVRGLDPSKRAAKIPQFLKGHEYNLLHGIKKGKVPYRGVVEFLINWQLPDVVTFLSKIDLRATEAYMNHIAFLRAKVLPHATEEFAIGEEEYEWRLQNTLMVKKDLKILVQNARDFLEKTRPEFIRLAGSKDLSEASLKVQALQQEVEKTQEALIPQYRDIMLRAANFISGGRLFHLPPQLDIEMEKYPAEMKMIGSGTNWPAPVLDERSKGQIVINPNPAAHSRPWKKVLAIHEGIPGHFFQSRIWHDLYKDDPAPVRFLLVADDIAIPRRYFGPMMNIEGYAVYAEDLMLNKNFYKSDLDRLFALASHRIRAVRVIVDIGLHTGAMKDLDAARILKQEIGLPADKARMELERYKRAPLQALTYFVGFQQILAIREKYLKKNPTASLADFHTWFFSFGPLQPALIEEALLKGHRPQKTL